MPIVRQLSPEAAQALVNAGKTPRARELERLQAYYDGTQYAGRPAYLDLSTDTPRLERAPCIKYPLVKAAIESDVALCLGDKRFPRVLSMSTENDRLFDPQFGLSEDESAVVDAFNAKLIDLIGFQASMVQAYRTALAARSVALVFCYRGGLPAVDCFWPSICTPTFDPSAPTELTSLEIRYRYIEYVRDAQLTNGEWWPIVKEYRRVIDAQADTTLVPKEIWDERDFAPSQTPAQVIKHGFGCCPARWYARQRPSVAVGSYDGIALHDGKLEEIDAINHALSSRHLAAMYTGDPMLVGTGISPDETLGTMGRAARITPADPTAPRTGWDTALYGGSGGDQRIRKGPGELWRTANDKAVLDYLTLPADALTALDNHAQDLCAKVREALRYVWLDPASLAGSGDISGKTLAFVYSSQTSAISQDRLDFGRNCFLPSLGMIYRMLSVKSDGVILPGLSKALPILKRFLVETANGPTLFLCPSLQLKWGDYFDKSDVDEATRVSNATSALAAKIILTKTAVEHVRDIFPIDNVDQYVEALANETAQKQADAIAVAQATKPAMQQTPPPNAAKPAVPPKAKSGNKTAKNPGKTAQA